MKKIPAVLLSAALAACATVPVPAPAPAPGVTAAKALSVEEVKAQRALELLAYFLEGTFDSVEQPPGYVSGAGDSTPVRLRITRLWPEREGEFWFYAEYTDPVKNDQVTRQRIMREAREGTSVYTYDYPVPGDARAAAGEWRKAKPFSALDPATLTPLPGCRTLWIVQHDALLAGGTEGNDCRGSGPEGSFEHVDWYLGSSFVRHWVKHVDRSGTQVAGLTGPSELRKVALKAQ